MTQDNVVTTKPVEDRPATANAGGSHTGPVGASASMGVAAGAAVGLIGGLPGVIAGAIVGGVAGAIAGEAAMGLVEENAEKDEDSSIKS